MNVREVYLKSYLVSKGLSDRYVALTADASTREYFRVSWNGTSAIVCIYPEPFDPLEQPYLDVSRLFLSCGLPVPEVLDVDGERGIIVQEDLGNRILRGILIDAETERRDRLRNEAMYLIARIQKATKRAFDTNSIASRLKFDVEKLNWELNFFKTHYFETYRKRPLSADTDELVSKEFLELSTELESRASVLCHRDFHAANLMLDERDQMRIIDHQDARIGSPAYDLVSFLLDRITEPPTPEFLAEKRRYFLDIRRTLGLPKIDEAEFAFEFRLQTVQRCLKAVGTFSYQSVNRGKTYFEPFIKPMFRIVLRAAGNLDRFPVLRELLETEIDGK
jgi:aminoglycoside/choline kinase family phosphotransferase